MTESSLLNNMPEVISIYADRSVSTMTARLLHGIEPLIREKTGMGWEQAYLARETIANATGLGHSKVIGEHYERQVTEAGVLVKVSDGKFAMHRTRNGGLRGIATGWTMSWDGWAPRDWARVDLPTAPYRVGIDRSALHRAMSPVASTWHKEQRAHRMACALLALFGYQRVLVDTRSAGEILGAARLTGWKALKDLERLRLAKRADEGWWVDLSPLFYDPEVLFIAPEVANREDERLLLRDTVFKRSGWALRTHARMCRKVLAEVQATGHVVRPQYAAAVGRSLRQAILYVARDLRDDPYAWGRPVEI